VKTIEQIAEDCGLDEVKEMLFCKVLAGLPDCDQEAIGNELDLVEIIGALYRRIEKLESGEIGVNQSKASEILLYLDNLGYGNSSLTIGDNILEAIKALKVEAAISRRCAYLAGTNRGVEAALLTSEWEAFAARTLTTEDRHEHEEATK